MLRAAVALADEDGLEALSMRSLAKTLGVEAMSLYNHVANKAALLDGMIELVLGEIEPPVPGDDWKAELRKRAAATRAALLRHPWAVGEMEAAARTGREPAHPRRGARLPARGRLRRRDGRQRYSVQGAYIYTGSRPSETGSPCSPAGGCSTSQT